MTQSPLFPFPKFISEESPAAARPQEASDAVFSSVLERATKSLKERTKPREKKLTREDALGVENDPIARPESEGVKSEPKSADSFLILEHKSVVPDTKGLTSNLHPSLRGEPNDVQERLAKAAYVIGQDGAFWRWMSTQTSGQEGEMVHRAQQGLKCASRLIFRTYFREPGAPSRLAGGVFCHQNHLCTFCSSRRAVRGLQRLVPKIYQRLKECRDLRPAMLTFTSRNHPDLRQQMNIHFKACARFLERRRNQKKGLRGYTSLSECDGGIASMETKRGDGSGLWHFHAHWLVLVPPNLNEDTFKGEWSELLGYKANSDFRYCESVAKLEPGQLPVLDELTKDCFEVLKYALKTTGLGWPDRLSAYLTLRRKRLVRTFGSLYGLKLPEDEVDDVSDMEGQPYRECVYRYVVGQFVKEKVSVNNGWKDWTQSG